MEQARYWMWTKREHSLCRVQVSTNSSCNSSWEEHAFAEDAAGSLGGYIWPPRSYSCSFCRREFKSAQALGGHMNVHRRDRARLKQSSICHNEILHPHNQNHVQNPCIQLSVPYPPQVCNLVYNPNPNYDQKLVASPSRDSAPTTQENCSEHTLFSSSHSSSVIREHQNGSFFSSPPSCLNSVPIEPDLLLGLDLVVHQNGQTGSGTEEVETKGCKRRRTDGSLLYPFLESSSGHSHHIQSGAPGLTSIEDLDLELRLGDRPKSNCKRSANEGNLRDTQ